MTGAGDPGLRGESPGADLVTWGWADVSIAAMSSTTSSSRRRRAVRTAAVTAAGVLSLALPAAAAAGEGTIAFVQDGDVHVVKPDGSGQRPVTTDAATRGAYASVAWAPDGTLWASHGQRLEHLTVHGDVLGTLDAPPLDHAILPTPLDLDVSPDGTKIAYTKVGGSCEAGCGTSQASGVVDVATGASLIGTWSMASGAAFLDDTTLVSAGPTFADIQVRRIGADERTFFNDGTTSMADLAVSADRRRAAWVTEDRRSVMTGQVSGDLLGGGTGGMTYACVFTPARPGGYVDPTFGPDDRAIAFAETDGIAVVPDATRASGDCAGIQGIRTVGRPGAHSPDWADVAWQPARPAEQPRPQQPQQPVSPVAPGRSGSPAGGSAGAGAVRGGFAPAAPASPGAGGTTRPAPERATVLSASRAKGVTVRVAVPRAGEVKAVLTVKGRTVARSSTRVRTAGPATIRVKLGAAARRAVRRGATATLRITAPGAPATTLTVRLR